MTRSIAARRTLAALAATPLLLAGLTACGDNDQTTATDPAGTSAQGAPAADLEAGDDVDPGEFTDRLAAGFENMTTAHVTMTADLGTAGSTTGEGDADYSADRPAVAMTMSSDMLPGGDGMDVRLVDGVLYLDLGALSKDKFWKLDLDDPDSPFGAMGAQLDPRSSIGLLEKGLESVTYVGDEDGLAHYEASVEPEALLDAMGPTGAAGGADLPNSFDYDIWLDDQDRVTRLTSTMGDLGSVEMTMSDFGSDVSIEAPPADQVTEMPDLFGDFSASPKA